MKKRYKYTGICILLIASLFLCGAGRFSIVTLDTDTYAIYENITAESLIQEYAGDDDAFCDKYDDMYLAVWGTVASTADGGKTLKLAGWEQSVSKTWACTAKNRTAINQIQALQKGAPVKVYGQVSVAILTGKVSFTVTKVESAENMTYTQRTYTSAGGFDYRLDNMTKVELSKGNVSYYIPESWKAVEHCVDNDRVYGYQYCLNEINRATAKAESLFVFYFGYDKGLKNPNDRTKTQEIQTAIINNILKKDAGTALEFTRTGYETCYGATYNYYNDTYKSPQNETYRVEFVFRNVGKEGVLVYLYVVHNDSDNDVKHLDDVMMVMRHTYL